MSLATTKPSEKSVLKKLKKLIMHQLYFKTAFNVAQALNEKNANCELFITVGKYRVLTEFCVEYLNYLRQETKLEKVFKEKT